MIDVLEIGKENRKKVEQILKKLENGEKVEIKTEIHFEKGKNIDDNK